MSEAHYQVYWLPDVKESLKVLGQAARAASLVDALKETLTELNDRLEQGPLEVGELYRGKQAVKEHVAAHRLLGIDFAVDTEKKIVVVRRCWALGNSGL
jgi:hypothetical protein